MVKVIELFLVFGPMMPSLVVITICVLKIGKICEHILDKWW